MRKSMHADSSLAGAARGRAAARARGGYTLIEMILVVAVLGIMGAILVPSLGDAQVLRVQSAVRTVVADITFAQTDALGYQARRAIVFDVDNNQYSVCEVIDTGGDITYEPLYFPTGIDGRYTVSLSAAGFDGSTLTEADFDGDPVLIFDELGTPVLTATGSTAGAGGSVYVEGSGSSFRIDVSAYTGRVSVNRVGGS